MWRRLGGGAAADRGVRPRKIGSADGAAGALSNVVGWESSRSYSVGGTIGMEDWGDGYIGGLAC